MPRRRDTDLPSTLQRSSTKAQDTFTETLASAEETYDDEQAAHRVAYSSLKHSFEKVGDHWEPKASPGPSDAQSARQTGPSKRDDPLPTAGGVDASAPKSHLLDLARRLEVKGRSRMRKEELVDAIDRANRKASAAARR